MKKFLAIALTALSLAFSGAAFAEDASATAAAAEASAPAAAVATPAADASAPAAAAAAAPVPNKGDTAWMIVSTLLVAMMTIPGLALFYGGLVRSKNMLSILMQCFVVFSLCVVLWVLYGYSLAFTEGGAFIGSFDKVLLKGDHHRFGCGDLQQRRLYP